MAIFCAGHTAKGLHQLRTIYPAFQWVAAFASNPNERHAVGYDEIRVIQDPFKRLVMLSFHDTVHPGNGNEVTRRTPSDPFFYPCDDIGNLDSIHLHPQHAKATRRWSLVKPQGTLRSCHSNLMVFQQKSP